MVRNLWVLKLPQSRKGFGALGHLLRAVVNAVASLPARGFEDLDIAIFSDVASQTPEWIKVHLVIEAGRRRSHQGGEAQSQSRHNSFTVRQRPEHFLNRSCQNLFVVLAPRQGFTYRR